jgi:SAM-dependent methyltransferase
MTASRLEQAEHVDVLSPEKVVDFEDAWYENTDPHHFWMEWRLAATLRFLRGVGASLESPLCALDVGGGHGILRLQLESNTVWKIDLADVNSAALVRCAPGRGRTLCYDVMEQHGDMIGRYDVVLCFDVLEHIRDERPFLEAIAQHIKPGGLLVMSVPAVQGAYSAYDRILGHHRRYNAGDMRETMAGCGLTVLRTAYWGLLLMPALVARRLLMPASVTDRLDHEQRTAVMRNGCVPPARAADILFRIAGRVEQAIPFRLPIGSSLLSAAKRPE